MTERNLQIGIIRMARNLAITRGWTLSQAAEELATLFALVALKTKRSEERGQKTPLEAE